MGMAETQSGHRQQLESKIVDAQIKDAQDDRKEKARAQWFALAIALAGLTISAYVITHDHPIAGSCIGGATLVALVTAFLAGRRLERTEQPTKKKK